MIFKSQRSALTIEPGAEWEFCGERRTRGSPLTGLDPFPPWNFRKEICSVFFNSTTQHSNRMWHHDNVTNDAQAISQLYKSKHLLKRAAIRRWKSSITLTKSSLTHDWHLIQSWLNAESSTQSFTYIKIITDLGPSAGRLSWEVKKKNMVIGYNHFSVSVLHHFCAKH